MTDKSTCSSGGRLARTSPLPENGWDLAVSTASSLSTLYDFALKLERAGCCGKMSPRHFQATTERTSQDLFLSWKNVFPTLRAAITPAITRNECFHLSFCDANGTRKDRKNGGLYVTKAETSQTVTAKGPHTETVVIALDGDKMAKAERKGGSGLGVSEDGVMYTQTVKDVHAVAYDECVPLDLRNATRDPEKHDAQNRQGVGVGEDGAPMNTVTAASVPGVGWQATVRKLLPIECERLMGFPDNWTRISWKGKPEEECPDAPRYKACGNSMCVNVMAWIGERIEAVNQKLLQMK